MILSFFFMKLVIDPANAFLPHKVLADPDNHKDNKEYRKISNETEYRMFHPFQKICDCHHKYRNYQKIDTGLL